MSDVLLIFVLSLSDCTKCECEPSGAFSSWYPCVCFYTVTNAMKTSDLMGDSCLIVSLGSGLWRYWIHCRASVTPSHVAFVKLNICSGTLLHI